MGILCAIGQTNGQMIEMYTINKDGEIKAMSPLESWMVLEILEREMETKQEQEETGYIFDDKGRKFQFSTSHLEHSSLYPDDWQETKTTDYHQEDQDTFKEFFKSIDEMTKHIKDS